MTHVFTERAFMYNKIFLKNLLQKFVVHIYTLLLASFSSKLIKYLRHSESFNIRKNSEIGDIFLQSQRFSNIFQRLTVPRIIDPFWRKMYQKKRMDVDYKTLRVFSKNILLYMNSRQSKIGSVNTYVCYTPGRFTFLIAIAIGWY